MLPLDDPKWKGLHGGYRMPYDASLALQRLEQGESVWEELWDNLHHQGTIGEASLAAVPQLVRIASRFAVRDWSFYSMVSTIEIERHRKKNPSLPDWLKESYWTAWSELLNLALNDLRKADDSFTVQSLLGTIALAKRQVKLGTMISYLDKSELDEHLEQFLVWSELYD